LAWVSVLHALWLFLPAYVANMSPVFSAKLVPRWTAPIDGGRTARDGTRILGPGKTWRGLVGAMLAGALTALFMGWAAPPHEEGGFLNGWDFGVGGYDGAPVGSSCAEDAASDTEPRLVACPEAPRTPWASVALFGAIVGGSPHGAGRSGATDATP
jgi:hypothetical protein